MGAAQGFKSLQNTEMMGTLTVILGLCGSGKTHLIEHLEADLKFDEGFQWNLNRDHERLVAALREGRHCIVIEVDYCIAQSRDKFVAWITNAVPGVTIQCY